MNDTAKLSYPGSRRVYIPGRLHPDVQVPMREVVLSDTLLPDGTTHPNDPVRIYDCSGPWGDGAYEGSAEQGLPALRAAMDTLPRRCKGSGCGEGPLPPRPPGKTP